MQGLFRNPLADPGIVGISAGAGLGAVLAILLGGALPAVLAPLAGRALVPLAAFAGSWITTALLYRVATRGGQTSIATMLARRHTASPALAGALTGIALYLADDAQLRDMTFWGLGSLAGATWGKRPSRVRSSWRRARRRAAAGARLNAPRSARAAAMHLGIPVERLKSGAVLAAAAATGAAVGGLRRHRLRRHRRPHLLRLTIGPDHRTLLPAAALLGAALLVLADVLTRTLVAPAELPIGIVTALVGAPVFLWLLLGRRQLAGF